MKYFPLLYRLRAEKRYLIWISDEKDSVVVDAGGFVPSFCDLIVLRKYAQMNRYSLENEEPILHDLDWVARWVATRDAQVDCKKALAAWNLFGDIAASVSRPGNAFDRLDSQMGPMYPKLFWGNNLLSMTPQGRQYIPEWSPEEITSLADVLTAGLDLFVSCIANWPPEN